MSINGRMTVIDAQRNQRITIQAKILKPFRAMNRMDFTLAPVAGRVSVTWAMSCMALARHELLRTPNMQIVPYLAFDGTCREAFDFYAKVLKGKIEMAMTIGESPFAAQHPPEAQKRIMHIRLAAESATLMGGDAPLGQGKKPQAFSICIAVNDAKEAERIFKALSDGGKIDMPFAKTFWADSFGMCTDKFGIPWMVNGNLHDPT